MRPQFQQDLAIASMAALQDYNDHPSTTFPKLVEMLRTIPVREDRPNLMSLDDHKDGDTRLKRIQS